MITIKAGIKQRFSLFFLLSVAIIPFCTTFTQNSIFIKPATTTSYRVINGKVVIFKDKDNNNNLIYSKLFPIGLHFSTFLYNCLLMRVCDDVIKNTLLHFTTDNTDIMLKIIKRQKKVLKLFGIPFLCCIFVGQSRDNNLKQKSKMEKLKKHPCIKNNKFLFLKWKSIKHNYKAWGINKFMSCSETFHVHYSCTRCSAGYTDKFITYDEIALMGVPSDEIEKISDYNFYMFNNNLKQKSK